MKPHRALLVAALTLCARPAGRHRRRRRGSRAPPRRSAPTRQARPTGRGPDRRRAQRVRGLPGGGDRPGPAGVGAACRGLEGLDAKLSRVEYIIASPSPSAADGATGRWPDALVPDVDDVVGEKRNAFPFDVAAGESRAIWVEVHVPAGAPAGAVTGQVTVTTADGRGGHPGDAGGVGLRAPVDVVAPHQLRPVVRRGRRGARRSPATPTPQLRARYGQLALDHRSRLTGLNDDGYHADMSHFDRFYGPLVDGSAPTRARRARAHRR